MASAELSSTAEAADPTAPVESVTTSQIRGSTLLLVGRVVTLAINLVTQVLIARHLSKGDFGAFAYAIAFVSLGETLVGFGLGTAITRFVPIFHERRDYDKLFGTILGVVVAIASLGLSLVLVTQGLRGLVTRGAPSHDAASLLLILVALAPLGAIDSLLMNMFAVFARPRQIFFRRHVLEPGLRLIVVLVLVTANSGVFFLAGGYVAIGAFGLILYAVIFVRLLRKQGLLAHFNRRTMSVPAREVLTFTLPLLVTYLVWPVMNATDAVLLGHYRGTPAVASLRVVLPAAAMNQLIMSSFSLLFTPMAARLFARRDREGIEHLYWQTAIFSAVITFPVFAATFLLARPLTSFVYGARYASSAKLLSLLAVGEYAQAVTGFNGTILMIYGKLRYIVVTNLLAVAINLVINLILIPPYGALGAAIGTSSTLVILNIFKQAGLRLTGVSVLPRRHVRVYLSIALAAVVLLVARVLAPANAPLGLALVGSTSLALLAVNRRALRIEQTFPELRRFRAARLLLG